MKLEIKDKKENPLLSRIEYTAYLSFEGATPSLPEIKKELAKVSNTEPDLIDIVKAETHFGETKATVAVNVYPNLEAKKKVMGKVPKKHAEKLAKVEEAQKKATEEKKAAAEKPKEAAPVESSGEAKEEAKKEASPETDTTKKEEVKAETKEEEKKEETPKEESKEEAKPKEKKPEGEQ